MAKTKTKSNPGSTPAVDVLPVSDSSPQERLHDFTKVILRPGTFRKYYPKQIPGSKFDSVNSRWFREYNWSENYLKTVAEQAKKQLEAGIKIPAPFAHHDEDGRAIIDESLLGKHDERFVFRSDLNGGFWKDSKFVEDASQINPDFKPGPAWIGTVEAPGDPTDANTPAGKIGTTIQETSVHLLPKYVDSKGTEHRNFVAHIAMPVHALEQSQDNFALAMSADTPEDEIPYAVSMSDMIPGATDSGGQDLDPEFAETMNLLRSVKIVLPQTTTRDNFISVLNIALQQKVADQQEQQAQNKLTNAPPGSQTRSSPVAMSAEDGDLTMPENNTIKLLLNQETKRKKKELTDRLNTALASGAAIKQDTLARLRQSIEAISMSAEDISDSGEFPTPTVENEIAIIEEMAVSMTGSVLDGTSEFTQQPPQGSLTQELPSEGGTPDLAPEYQNEILDRNFAVVG